MSALVFHEKSGGCQSQHFWHSGGQFYFGVFRHSYLRVMRFDPKVLEHLHASNL